MKIPYFVSTTTVLIVSACALWANYGGVAWLILWLWCLSLDAVASGLRDENDRLKALKEIPGQ